MRKWNEQKIKSGRREEEETDKENQKLYKNENKGEKDDSRRFGKEENSLKMRKQTNSGRDEVIQEKKKK